MRDKNKGLIPDCSMIKDEIIVLFLKQCWSLNPSERPTFDDIVSFIFSERIQQALRVRIETIISYLDLIYESLFNSNNKHGIGFKYKILGFKYYYGINVERSQLNTAKYFLISSAYGCTNSMFQFARMRQKGRGILVNKAEALMFYESGVLMGNLECMYNLAYMFRDGEGIEKKSRRCSILC